MRCRTLSVRLEQPFAAIDEAGASEFLTSVQVRKVTAELIAGPDPAWSLLVLFDEAREGAADAKKTKERAAAGRKTRTQTAASGQEIQPQAAASERKTRTQAAASGREIQLQATPPATDPVPDDLAVQMSAEEERLVQSIKQWRSARAAADSMPPYCIAHNSSIEQIALTHPSSLEDLAAIKGFGPLRIDKYGAEILALVASGNGSSPA